MKTTTGILSLSVALLTACGGNSGNNVTAPTLDTTTTAVSYKQLTIPTILPF
ncbi:MAG: hypothetical protein K2I26_09675 [Paramuribaculum sp.]|nr:hypothetical protein [Paramuribaculum sp.]